MTPGLALFYGGMVRRKNVLATMMHSIVALAVVGVYWIAIGYCLAFGQSWRPFGETWGGLIGWSPKLIFLHGVQPGDLLPGTNIPIYLHVMFQGMFAIITPALISGAIAERIRFLPYCLFLILWSTFVYCPLAHWVWAMNWWDGGWCTMRRPPWCRPDRCDRFRRWDRGAYCRRFIGPGCDSRTAETTGLSRTCHAPQQHGAHVDGSRFAVVRLVRV